MGKSSALLAFCVGNSPATGEFHAQRPVTRSFDVFFDLRLNKQLSKQSWCWWLETPSRSLWRQCNDGCIIATPHSHNFPTSQKITTLLIFFISMLASDCVSLIGSWRLYFNIIHCVKLYFVSQSHFDVVAYCHHDDYTMIYKIAHTKTCLLIHQLIIKCGKYAAFILNQ